MATVTRVHPVTSAVNVESIGNLQFLTVDYVNTAASTGPEGAQEAVKRALMDTATIVAVGPMLDTNTQQTFAVEAIGGDNVVASAAQTAIRALGTVDSVNLGSATVTLTQLGILTAAVV